MTFEQLMREHDEIDTLTYALEACCADAGRPAERVIAARSTLRTVLEAHLAHEDATIYHRLMLANRQSAEAVRRFDEDFAVLRTDWGVYLDDWDAECLACDWDGFARETAAIMTRVRERTKAETGLLYPMALRTGAIGLRAR